MTQTTKPRLQETALERVEDVIREFVSHSNQGLFETQIQKLIFYGEVYCVVHYRARLTKAKYKPYMFGAFSPDVRYALENMDEIGRERTIKYGKRTVRYTDVRGGDGLDDDSKRIIEVIHEATTDIDTEELAQFSKGSYLFKNTEYNHPMNFEEFAEALDNKPDIENELKDQMPDILEFESEDNLVMLE